VIGKHEMEPQEAAAALGLTVEQLVERAMDGQIPQAKLDRRGWVFRREAIERLAARRAA
jgi:hypothetical protein